MSTTESTPIRYDPPPQYVYVAPQAANGMAVASMVVGLVGLLLWPLAILAVIFGHVALSELRRNREPGEGFAVTGLVCGYIVCGLWAAWWLLLLVLYGLGSTA